MRSEVFRRALESLDPGIATIGFAGFFGLPLAHRAAGTDETAAHLPVFLTPGLTSTSHAAPSVEEATRIAARTTRAWGRFRQAAVSSFAFVAAPREVTVGADLAGRAFLHSYDWWADTDFATLDLILTAPVVVASWISLQYYGSSLAPEVFGGGNKLIHNVTGGIGVVQGNGGVLRPGLPWQTLHDGARLMHDPLRLSVLIEAPQAAMSAILDRHDGVRDLFDNGWLHLLAPEDGRIAARYRPRLKWETMIAPARAA